MSDALLKRAADKAEPRRFTAEPPTGFGPLLPSDNLVERPHSRCKVGREVTLERLREALSYEPTTGVFTWRVGCRAGTEAGTRSNGYVAITIDQCIYRAHRLAWFYAHGVWPTHQIDHINGRRSDNRLANLREVTNSLNQQNQSGPQAGNSTGYLGVFQRGNRFEASITADGRYTYLGLFPTAEAAHAAYAEAKRKQHAGAVPNFPALRPEDDLVARIEKLWNLPPGPRLSDVKREEVEADARGEDLWLARGGEA